MRDQLCSALTHPFLRRLVDSQSLRSDIQRLQRTTGMQLKLPTLSDVLGTEMDEASAAAKLQSSMFLESIEGCPVPSHTKMLYPWCESKPERVFLAFLRENDARLARAAG